PEAQAAFAADLGAKQRRDVVAVPAEGGGDVIAVRVLYSDRRRRDPGSGARRRDERAMARDRLVERESGNNVRRREDDNDPTEAEQALPTSDQQAPEETVRRSSKSFAGPSAGSAERPRLLRNRARESAFRPGPWAGSR